MERKLFGNHLRALRKGRQLTQSRLAERAQVSLRSVAYWEKGQVLPHKHELGALLEALEVPREEQATLFVQLFPRHGERDVHQHPAMPSEAAHMLLCGPGDLLMALRMRRRMSREELASRLQISLSTLSRWENNRYAISEDALAQIESLLSVSEREMQALRKSLSRLALSANEPEYDALRSYDHEQAMHWVTQFEQYRYQRVSEMVDLTAFALRQRLWRLSAVHPQARFALARLSLDYASWLFRQERAAEAALHAQQALTIYEKAQATHAREFGVALNLLSASAMRRSIHGNEAALRFLRPWLTRATATVTQATLFADAAVYAARMGKAEIAERYIGASARVFARVRQNPTLESDSLSSLFSYLHVSRARVLLENGKPCEAFDLLFSATPFPNDTVTNDTLTRLIFCAQIALAAGERGSAEQWLQRIERKLEHVDFPMMRQHADAIARRLA